MMYPLILSKITSAICCIENDAGSTGGGGSNPLGAAARQPTLKELIEASKRDAVKLPGGAGSSAPPIRRLPDDFSRVYPQWCRRVIGLDGDKFEAEGLYVLSTNVADEIAKRRRSAKWIFDCMLYLACDGTSNTFLTYAKIDPSRAASSYAEAIAAAEKDWVWVRWTGGRDGAYAFGPPDKPKAPPVWPDDRTPDEICDAVYASGRYIESIDHWLVQRILNG